MHHPIPSAGRALLALASLTLLAGCSGFTVGSPRSPIVEYSEPSDDSRPLVPLLGQRAEAGVDPTLDPFMALHEAKYRQMKEERQRHIDVAAEHIAESDLDTLPDDGAPVAGLAFVLGVSKGGVTYCQICDGGHDHTRVVLRHAATRGITVFPYGKPFAAFTSHDFPESTVLVRLHPTLARSGEPHIMVDMDVDEENRSLKRRLIDVRWYAIPWRPIDGMAVFPDGDPVAHVR